MKKVNKNRKTWTEKGYTQGYKESHAAGYQKGYRKGVAEYKTTYPCCICGGELVMKPGSKDHEEASKHLRKLGWHHAGCSSR